MMDKRTEIENLINKAATAEKSEDALRFSQAAVNASNAVFTTNQTKLPIKDD